MLRERLIDGRDVVGDALRLGEQLLGLLDRLLELRQRRIGQARQVLGLVDQHVGLVLQALDLVVDLLQLARRREDVLREIGRIEDDPLRVGGNAGGHERERGDAGGERRAETTRGHRETSWMRVVSMSAAQSRPLPRSQAAANPSRPWAASDLGDGGLIGLGRRGGEGERDLAQAQLEQAVAAARLAVIVALRRRAAEDLDLAIVQPEAAIDGCDLRFERALVRQEHAASGSSR